MEKYMTNTKLLDTVGAAKYVGCSASFLNKRRLDGNGPIYIKVGGSVRYTVADLDAWLASCRRTSTSQRPIGDHLEQWLSPQLSPQPSDQH